MCESSLLANDLAQVACLPSIWKSYVFHLVCRHVCVQCPEQMAIQLRLALEEGESGEGWRERKERGRQGGGRERERESTDLHVRACECVMPCLQTQGAGTC